jgi:hypothetical protein
MCNMSAMATVTGRFTATIPPQADAGWIGEVGPGPSYRNILRAGLREAYVRPNYRSPVESTLALNSTTVTSQNTCRPGAKTGTDAV